MLKLIANSVVKSSSETAGVANRVDVWRIFKSITFGREVDWGDDATENLLTLCA